MRLFSRSAPAVPQMTVAQLAARTDAGERFQILDVREHSEWNEGHIPGSIHIPLGELAARASELDRDRPLVAVCRSGNRSQHAAVALQRAGFGDVANLGGGVTAWARARMPVER
jgi:rhodanese-related sulfurtransferase